MGYKTKDIADITEPKIVTLSGLPNFVTFSSKEKTVQFLELNLTVLLTPTTSRLALLKLVDPTGAVHSFTGTTDITAVGGSTFYVSEDTSETTENIRQALLSDKWVASNFDIVAPFVWQNNKPTNGSKINIKSKGVGSEFNISLSAPYDIAGNAYIFNWVRPASNSGDTISGESSTVQIELDVYTDTGVFLGEVDKAETPQKMGKPLISLQKTYAGTPIWFELNAIFANSIGYNRPASTGWFNPGTLKDLRFVAKVKGANSYPFYQSSVLYILRGSADIDEAPEMEDFVYDNKTVKLLTNKPTTTYVRGQKAFLNFILKRVTGDNYELNVAYRVYSSSGRYLATEYAHPVKQSNLNTINTCVLDIDAVLDKWPTAGRVKVALARNGSFISNDLEYEILPACLHSLRQFSFINMLGGWDCFNFDAALKTDLKQTTETYIKTITPNYRKGDSIETAYTSDVEQSYTVESAPLKDDVTDWLKELAAATVILDGDGRYVIKEDLTIQKTADKFNMQKAVIKYRL